MQFSAVRPFFLIQEMKKNDRSMVNTYRLPSNDSYKKLRNKIVNLCCESKKSYFQTFFAKNGNNAKRTWRGINSLININTSSKYHPNSLIIDNEISFDSGKIANKFNNYFASIANQLQSKIYRYGQDFTKYLKNRNECTFFLRRTEETEIINIIKSINVCKVSG